VLNATFSNISAISWRPVVVMEEAAVLYIYEQTYSTKYKDRPLCLESLKLC